jgi:hypothetical protein
MKRMMMAKGGIEGGFSTKLSEFSIPRAPFAYHNVLSDFNPGQRGRALMNFFAEEKRGVWRRPAMTHIFGVKRFALPGADDFVCIFCIIE